MPTTIDLNDTIWGLAAGLGTSVGWTGTAIFFTAAGKRLGVAVMNLIRLLMAIVFLGVTHRLLFGDWLPGTNSTQVAYLAASGLLGLTIGDQALFTAFLDIGPRLSTLIMTTSPLFATGFAYLALGETLSPVSWLGVLMTVAGVAWVVAERDTTVQRPKGYLTRGVILALIGAICQAGGLLLSKQGMGHGWLPKEQHLNPQSATLIRMLFATAGMTPIIALSLYREAKRRANGTPTLRIGAKSTGLIFAFCGAIFGPYLGVWLSLIATDRAPVGVAQTMCSLAPVILLPILHYGFKERVTPRAVLGAIISVAGIALLFWKNA